MKKNNKGLILILIISLLICSSCTNQNKDKAKNINQKEAHLEQKDNKDIEDKTSQELNQDRVKDKLVSEEKAKALEDPSKINEILDYVKCFYYNNLFDIALYGSDVCSYEKINDQEDEQLGLNEGQEGEGQDGQEQGINKVEEAIHEDNEDLIPDEVKLAFAISYIMQSDSKGLKFEADTFRLHIPKEKVEEIVLKIFNTEVKEHKALPKYNITYKNSEYSIRVDSRTWSNDLQVIKILKIGKFTYKGYINAINKESKEIAHQIVFIVKETDNKYILTEYKLISNEEDYIKDEVQEIDQLNKENKENTADKENKESN